MTEQEIKDNMTKVCICKSISKRTIKEAINNGAKTVADVKKATGAGTGACKGARCISAIEDILKEA